MKKLLLTVLLCLFPMVNSMAADEIAYNPVKTDGDIQIRDYQATVVAEMTMSGSRRDTPNNAFRPLFNYIQGANTAAQDIPMTTPVSQTASIKIPMTVPVSQQQADANEWTIAFYMPNGMRFEETPTPKDSRINIRAVPAKRMAAIQFSGRATDRNINKHEQELRDYLVNHQIPFIDQPIYAFYNSPFTLWFLRRNEVLFELESSSL